MQDAEGKTAMHWAAAGGRTELLKLLVQMGASTEIADSIGRLPLHFAAQVLLMPLCFTLALLHRLISLKLHLLLLECLTPTVSSACLPDRFSSLLL